MTQNKLPPDNIFNSYGKDPATILKKFLTNCFGNVMAI